LSSLGAIGALRPHDGRPRAYARTGTRTIPLLNGHTGLHSTTLSTLPTGPWVQTIPWTTEPVPLVRRQQQEGTPGLGKATTRGQPPPIRSLYLPPLVCHSMLQVYACGVAFSGKSTLARRIADELSISVISLDAINHERGLRGGEGMSITQWEETSAIAMDRLGQCLREGKSAVVDDTFSRRFPRDRCKVVALECGAEFTIVFVDTPIAEIRARRDANYQRATRHHVRDDVFEDHYKTFQFPTPDEPVVRVAGGFDLQSWLNEEAARL